MERALRSEVEVNLAQLGTDSGISLISIECRETSCLVAMRTPPAIEDMNVAVLALYDPFIADVLGLGPSRIEGEHGYVEMYAVFGQEHHAPADFSTFMRNQRKEPE